MQSSSEFASTSNAKFTILVTCAYHEGNIDCKGLDEEDESEDSPEDEHHLSSMRRELARKNSALQITSLSILIIH